MLSVVVRRRTLRALAACSPLLAVMSFDAPVMAQTQSDPGVDIVFPFEDARRLQAGEKNGGLVHRPDPSAKGAQPLVVFLHGVNEKGPLHRGLGGGGFDLRATVRSLVQGKAIVPAMIAGPSQTQDAWTGSRLWSGFDLAAFVDAVEEALPSDVRVDRARVVLVGHSGAGCNPTGGLLAKSKLVPISIVALDTCLDVDFGKRFGELADVAPVRVYWQSQIWPRDPEGFRKTFEATLAASSTRVGSMHQLDVPGSGNPHDDMAPLALERVLREVLPKPDDDG